MLDLAFISEDPALTQGKYDAKLLEMVGLYEPRLRYMKKNQLF